MICCQKLATTRQRDPISVHLNPRVPPADIAVLHRDRAEHSWNEVTSDNKFPDTTKYCLSYFFFFGRARLNRSMTGEPRPCVIGT